MPVEYLSPIPPLTGKAARDFQKRMDDVIKGKIKEELSEEEIQLCKEIDYYSNKKNVV